MPLPCDPITRSHRARQRTMAMKCKPTLNALAITFNGRITPTGD
ncbi:hypothetical protein L837_5166 [Mycobacterium avium MAV_061107_1842]|nr:hypothetical protein L837_5166 [Mycobacterium avium MAV_061107_1842]